MDALVHRPVGDLLEEILNRGAGRFPSYLEPLPGSPVSYRIAVLLGGLCLGPEAEDELRERLTRRDSVEKSRLVMGLAEVGHPLAEGPLARILRERSAEDAAAAALRGLGRIRGSRSLPLVRSFLDHPSLSSVACEALAEYGGAVAAQALLDRSGEFAAFRALAEIGDPSAREVFVEGLGRGDPWDTAAAHGLGRIGNPEAGTLLLPLLDQNPSPALERAAFEAYARLGAPQGTEALLQVARHRLEPWMVPALGMAGGAEVQRFLLESLRPQAASGFFGRLFRRARPSPADPTLVYRGLRGASDPEAVAELLARLRSSVGVRDAREILENQALRAEIRYAEALLPLWREADLPVRYLATRTLLQAPIKSFLVEAMDFLAKPGFIPLDDAPAGADIERMMEGYAQDNNPCLLLGGFVDSELFEPVGFAEVLRKRFSGQEFPESEPPETLLSSPGEHEIGTFLASLTRVNPGTAAPLARLWNLLDGLEDRGERMLDLFLVWTGVHRGPFQRAIVHGMPAALGCFVHGKSDRHLPELEEIADHAPREGPLAAPLRDALETARNTLKAECRDMALLLEGRPQRGDMVLVEVL